VVVIPAEYLGPLASIKTTFLLLSVKVDTFISPFKVNWFRKKINYLYKLITKPTHTTLSAGVINNSALCKKYRLYREHGSNFRANK
jgi:hypothetical protein